MRAEHAVAETSLGDYLRDVASGGAVPGGGSAAAVAAAMGAALGAMVSRISARKAKGSEIQAELNALLPEFERLVDRLLALSQEDIDAYAEVLRIRKEARTSGKEPDPAELAMANETAARVPLSTAALSQRGLDLLGQLQPMAFAPTLSDVRTAELLLLAGLGGGLSNVQVNLEELTGTAREQIEKAYLALKSTAR